MYIYLIQFIFIFIFKIELNINIDILINIMKILVFDTETTGLPSERNPSIFEPDKFPYIVQISYILYNTEDTLHVPLIRDYLINVNDIIISQGSINIHKITQEMSNTKGVQIKEILEEFNNILLQADIIIGHNIEFDKTLIMVECIRNNVQQYFNFNNIKKIEYCTMKNSIDLCKIERKSKFGRKYFKYPTLGELHNHLFNEFPQGLHNSLVDVITCLRCYLKIQYDIDILLNTDINNILLNM